MARGRGGTGQLSLVFPKRWGGARKGAGRKPAARRKVPHRARDRHHERHPVHVTLRAAFRPLRSQRVFATLQRSLVEIARRHAERFRVLHYSVQFDHLHLIAEAADARALSRGVQGLTISMARRVNRSLGRRGSFWADRFHSRPLESPRALRNALVYVLANFRKHAGRRFPAGIDLYSSAVRFDGWLLTEAQRRSLERISPRAPPDASVARPRTWLARLGWRRHGLIALTEQPKRPS